MIRKIVFFWVDIIRIIWNQIPILRIKMIICMCRGDLGIIDKIERNWNLIGSLELEPLEKKVF